MAGKEKPKFDSASDIEGGQPFDINYDSDGVAPVAYIPSNEGIITFQGFTDDEQPQAAAWLARRFKEIKDEEPLPPAA
jgi:hypothetical protein